MARSSRRPAPAAPAAPAPDLPPSRRQIRYETGVEISSLELATYNPREIEGDNLGNLGASIQRFGLVQPVVVSERDGVRRVVGGHQRIKALLAAGETTVDIAIGSWTEAEERALNITLNNPANQGRYTEDLAAELDRVARGLNAGDFLDLGLDDLFEKPKSKGARKRRQGEELSYKVVVECRDEAHQAEVLAQLEADGLEAQPLIA